IVTLPRLGVAAATARRVWCTGVDANGNVAFSWAQTPKYRELSWSRRNSLSLEGVFAAASGYRGRATSEAVVPTVPPQSRPAGGLDGYHVMFEAEWEASPQASDPALLKHVG